MPAETRFKRSRALLLLTRVDSDCPPAAAAASGDSDSAPGSAGGAVSESGPARIELAGCAAGPGGKIRVGATEGRRAAAGHSDERES